MKNNILNRKFRYTYSNAAAYLVAVNVIVFIAVRYVHPVINGVSLVYWLSLVPVLLRPWQFVTYMFVHMDFMHLFFNMYALLMFGVLLERTIGTREFLLFYFVSGVLGGVISYFVYTATGNTMLVILGASGAVYALLFLTSVMYPHGRILLFFILPLKMPVAVLLFIILEVFYQVAETTGGVAHLVHLASIAVAWVYCLLRFRVSPVKVWRDALLR